MKLSRLSMVLRYTSIRDKLVNQLKLLAEQGKLRVSIDGDLQDDTIVELIKPRIVAEINARISSLDRDLEALGVEIA